MGAEKVAPALKARLLTAPIFEAPFVKIVHALKMVERAESAPV